MLAIADRDGSDTKDVALDNGVFVGEFYREVDGYYVWLPVLRGGYLPSYFLRAIADALDNLNAEWDEIVQNQFLSVSESDKISTQEDGDKEWP